MVAGLVGYAVADARFGPDEQTGTAHTGLSPNAVSFEGDDGTYWMPTDVTWTDESGQWHIGGRPECIPASGAVVENVRFVGQRLQLNAGSHLQVIAVYCDKTPDE